MIDVEEKKLVIIKDWCKGCGICVEFCPKNILYLKEGKISITNEEECIKCGLCELRCPDYALYLKEDFDE